MIREVAIAVIDHKEQLYPTSGNYWYDKDKQRLTIVVSKTDDWRESIAVAIHELVEASLCLDRGINFDDITTFDIDFERAYAVDPLRFPTDEPGEMPEAPYFKEHAVADVVERLVVKEFGIPWVSYDRNLEALMDEGKVGHE